MQGSSCVFEQIDGVLRLRDDCATSVSIAIPAGMTLDGRGHVIVAMDPERGGFRGGVVAAFGGMASVINTRITAMNLADICQRGASRLRGIYFEGASGTIRENIVEGINKGPSSGCEEGNAIEVRNAPDASEPAIVEIVGNVVDGYQKGGILVHGHVEAYLQLNQVGASAARERVPANAVQIGPGAMARVWSNEITASPFLGTDDAAGTAVLLVETAPGTLVSHNSIRGGDVGVYVIASGVVVEQNALADAGPDGRYDIGIVNLGEDNVFAGNTVRDYRTRYFGVEPAATGNRQIE